MQKYNESSKTKASNNIEVNIKIKCLKMQILRLVDGRGYICYNKPSNYKQKYLTQAKYHRFSFGCMVPLPEKNI